MAVAISSACLINNIIMRSIDDRLFVSYNVRRFVGNKYRPF